MKFNMNWYFRRRFKTLTGVKIAIFLKRPYDFIRLKLRGEKILSQSYTLLNLKGYTITNLIVTQAMIDDVTKSYGMDFNAELEEALKLELKTNDHE